MSLRHRMRAGGFANAIPLQEEIMMHNLPTLKTLLHEYQNPHSQLIVLYGRSGCGKEACIKQFLQNKPHLYYRARELSLTGQTQAFIREIAWRYRKDQKTLTCEACFNLLQDGSNAKLVLVIDEFDCLLKKGSDFLERLIRFKKNANKPPVMLLLCSSSLVFAEQKMPSILGKLFYEIDATCKMTELSFLELVRSFPGKTITECLELYSVTGGVPAYLKIWDAKKSTKENIIRQILSERGSLFWEAQRYLRTEFRELSVYNTALSILAKGSKKLNDLHQATGFSRAKISVYLKNLMEFEVIEKVVSLDTEHRENTQKGVYRFQNTFLHFWFRFVFPYMSDLYLLSPEAFYETHIAGDLGAYMECYFTRICTEYIRLMNRSRRLPIEAVKMSVWVGKQGSIDIVAQNAEGECLVGMCRFSKGKMGYEAYEKLTALACQAHLNAGWFYFFSGASFDAALRRKAAEDKRVILVDLAQL